MTQTKSRNIRELESVLDAAAVEPSVARIAALVARPEAVRSALAVVADVLSLQRVPSSFEDEADIETVADVEPLRVDAREAVGLMSARSRPGTREELLTSNELAARVGLKTRQSVHDWLKWGRIVGWRGAKRGYVFPTGQFDERGRPPKGLEQVVPHFDDGYAAWIWLTTPRPSLDGMKPLVLLGRGQSDRVAAAAEGDGQGDFA